MSFYPFKFHPLFMERLWGGRELEKLYGKALPPGKQIGESWEIADRPDATSVISNGALAGKSLRWLMENHAREIIGGDTVPERFPLLVKILDAQDKLSIQVHPRSTVASRLKGEPKTEMWYIAQAQPNAELYVGLNSGVTREEFEQKLHQGAVAECIHRVPVATGDVMFLPSGRIHAIGAGLVIFEIQQNSDTTYRVFDWNRVDANGKARELHIAESLASIDFSDYAPEQVKSKYSENRTLKVRFLVHNEFFQVDAWRVKRRVRFHMDLDSVQILGILQGRLTVQYGGADYLFGPGEFALLPAALERCALHADTQVELLHVQLGSASSS